MYQVYLNKKPSWFFWRTHHIKTQPLLLYMSDTCRHLQLKHFENCKLMQDKLLLKPCRCLILSKLVHIHNMGLWCFDLHAYTCTLGHTQTDTHTIEYLFKWLPVFLRAACYLHSSGPSRVSAGNARHLLPCPSLSPPAQGWCENISPEWENKVIKAHRMG